MKDAYWFQHDSNAKDDPKCSMLVEQLGLEGYGIYWVLVETLREQPNYKYPLNLLPIIARKYNTTAEKVRVVVGNYGLFSLTEDEFFLSESLCRRMEHWDAKRQIASNAGKASAQKRLLLKASSTVVERTLNEGSTNNRTEQNRTEDKKHKKLSLSELPSDAVKLSKYLRANILEWKPNARVPKTDNELIPWVKSISLMIDRDKRNPDDIATIIEWATHDTKFWQANIMSASKLREKYDQLEAKMNQDKIKGYAR